MEVPVMKIGNLFAAIFSFALLAVPTVGHGQELDPTVSGAPKGLLVRVDASGNQVVYKSDAASSVSNNIEAERAISEGAKVENKIVKMRPGTGELNETTSNESWFFYYTYYPSPYAFSYYYYNYYSYGATYTYVPYYTYSYANYYWYYYRWW
jgi:hypothetical protein